MPIYYPHGYSEPYSSLRCVLLDAYCTSIEIAATNDFQRFHVPGNGLARYPGTLAALRMAFRERADSILDVRRNYAMSKKPWDGLPEAECVAMFRYITTTGFMVPTEWPDRGLGGPQNFPTMLQYFVKLDLVENKSSLGVQEPCGDIVWSTPLRTDVSGGPIGALVRELRAERDMLFMSLGQKETI